MHLSYKPEICQQFLLPADDFIPCGGTAPWTEPLVDVPAAFFSPGELPSLHRQYAALAVQCSRSVCYPRAQYSPCIDSIIGFAGSVNIIKGNPAPFPCRHRPAEIHASPKAVIRRDGTCGTLRRGRPRARARNKCTAKTAAFAMGLPPFQALTHFTSFYQRKCA